MLKGSQYSAIDGVPVCISEILQAPRKVADPMQYHSGNATDVMFLEYIFDLEEKVLASVCIPVQTENQQHNGLDSKEGPVVDSAVKSADSDTDRACPEAAAIPYTGFTGTSTNSTCSQPHTLLQPQPLKMTSSDILMPVQIEKTNSKPTESAKKSAANKALFDLADFENEEDPFDKMELRTLDDLEELNKVLCVDQSGFVNNFGELQVEVSKPNNGGVPSDVTTVRNDVRTNFNDSVEMEHFQNSAYGGNMLPRHGQFPDTQNAHQTSMMGSSDGQYQVKPVLRSSKSNPDLSLGAGVQHRQTSHTPPPYNMHVKP